MKCPKCESTNLLTERRPNGNSKCLDCGWKGSSSERVTKWTKLKSDVDARIEAQAAEIEFLKSEVEKLKSGWLNEHSLVIAERDKLKAENEALIEAHDAQVTIAKQFQQVFLEVHPEFEKRDAEIKTLQSKCEIYEAALKFYADKDNWTLATNQTCSAMIGPDDHDGVSNTSKYVAGAIARQAILTAAKAGEGE